MRPQVWTLGPYCSILALIHNVTFQDWSVDYVKPERNRAALSIANSVTKNLRSQSYVASGGHFWLTHLLEEELAATSYRT